MTITRTIAAIIAAVLWAGLATPASAQLQLDELAKSLMQIGNYRTNAVTLGDVDGDGDLDLVFGNEAKPGVQNRLYLNDGTSTYSDASGARMPVDNDYAHPATVPVTLNVTDFDGSSTYFRVTFIDNATGEPYPPLASELRKYPDLWVQKQLYRQTGDQVLVPPGTYTVEVGRGPEYLTQNVTLVATSGTPTTIDHVLQRWVHPAARDYYSGDHHLHTRGCIQQPSETGMLPKHMFAHVAGESLNVGEVLIFGPGLVTESKLFSAQPDPVSTNEHLIKYDIETAKFGPELQGHTCLLRLPSINYPGSGGTQFGWPSWNLPVLQWAKRQGGITGTVHSGFGLNTGSQLLPNYDIPPMGNIGAMEFFVDVAFDAVDLFSTVCTKVIPELNAWYHVQNCGYRVKISGGTDFPCIRGERAAGQGRVYLRVNRQPGEQLSYQEWTSALLDGKGYVSEGGSHLFDFQVNGRDVGENGSEVHLSGPGNVRITCTAAAWLPVVPKPIGINTRRWNIERARLPKRQVAVEIVVNSLPLYRQLITADGREIVIDQTLPIHKSSWVGLRILDSSHTNSMYVIVDGQPIRASKSSAVWCSEVTDRYWQQHGSAIKAAERPAARRAYLTAKSVYDARAQTASVGPFAAAEPYGQGCAGANGVPVIAAIGEPRIGNSSFAVTLSNAAVGVLPTLLLSRSKQTVPFGSCLFLLGLPAHALPPAPATNPSGASQLPIPIPALRSLEGSELFLQWLIPDAHGQLGNHWALSGGLAIHLSAFIKPSGT